MNVRAVPKWPLVLCVLAVLWLGVAGFSHLQSQKEGGVEAHLAELGCYGGAGSDAPTSDECAKAEASYRNWWMLPLGAVALTGLLTVGFAWASASPESDDPPVFG